MKQRLERLVKKNLNGFILVKVIIDRLVPNAGYIINVCTIKKGDWGELGKTYKKVLKRKSFRGTQSNCRRLYVTKEDGGRRFKNFRKVYAETEFRVISNMATLTN